MPTMFSKMTDMIEEEAEGNENIGIRMNRKKISSLLWVDDVATVAEGIEQQNKTLEFANKFAVKHKMEWGVEKSNVVT